MRRAAVAFVLLIAALPAAASASPSATVDGGSLSFFADTLAIVARDGAKLQLRDGTHATGDAAYVDLRNDRAVLAGHARLDCACGAGPVTADAIAVDLDGRRIDLLDIANGAMRTTRSLTPLTPEPIESERFAFPESEDARAFIRSRHATIVPHADVRFAPASFPSSVGAVPVPSYMYTFATAAGFGASSLSGATFDQPYALFGSQNALTALHARWVNNGASVALQEQVVSGDDSYVAASLDAPFNGGETRSLQAYRRMDGRTNFTLSGTNAYGVWSGQAALTRALGRALGRIQYDLASGGYSNADVRLRSPDRPLAFGATWSVVGDFGYNQQRGGYITQVPDPAAWSTVWYHALDGSIASPLVRGPLGTRLATTLDLRRTWYDFPHHLDDANLNATLSRALSRKVQLFFAYSADWVWDVYPGEQAVFYPPNLLPPVAPDGTAWLDRAAYTGATDARFATFTVQVTPDTNTSLRVAVARAAAFPQYHGYGPPPWEVRWEARLRPFHNFGIDIGRAYDFAWGGTRWVPRWTFAITP